MSLLSQSWMPPSGRIRLSSSAPYIRPDDVLTQARTSLPHLESSYLTTIQRRASELQEHLQNLLDDQSELLAAQVPSDHQAVFIHSTQSYSSSRASNGKVVPVRQPVSNKSLPTIRKDLQHAMTELATLRHEETQHLGNELHSAEDIARNIVSWQDRQKTLEREMETLQDTQDATRLERLQQDDSTLSQEIDAMELQLAELRSKQRIVRSELTSLDNTVQSKMSSYRAAMELLDKEVQNFLTLHNASRGKTSMNGSVRWLSQSQTHAPASSLSDIANTNAEAISRIRAACYTAKTEQRALDAGVNTWASVNTALRAFERQLAGYLRQQRGELFPATNSVVSSNRPISKDQLLELMDRTMEELESKLAYVDEHGWNLLVCAIGAEVQAFSVGREMLVEMLHGQSEVGKEDADANQEHVRKQSLYVSPNGSKSRSSREMKSSNPHRSTAQDVHSPVRTYVRRREKPYLAGSGEEDDEDAETDVNS